MVVSEKSKTRKCVVNRCESLFDPEIIIVVEVNLVFSFIPNAGIFVEVV